MELWLLFRTFLMIGFISFGGGYAMIPVIEREVTKYGWMTTQEFTDVIAIAGMSPGPIATNSAIFVGYQTAGILGAIVATLGMILPSLILILILATFFVKMGKENVMQSAFYGLRPIVTALIMYAALKFAISNEVLSFIISWNSISLLLIFLLSLLALLRFRWHPLYVILLSGVIGLILY